MVFPDNHFYGHGAALARHAGWTGADPIIFGHVQHGWMVGSGLLPVGREVPWIPKLVWSERNAKRARFEGHRKVTAIGSPFLYLPDLPDTESSHRTLVYPHHSWERDEIGGDHDTYIREIAAREPSGATVCLYWREFEDVAVRTRYERAGFEVVCHGRREDQAFIERVNLAVRRHPRVVTNRVGSAIWYAAARGCEVEVYGPAFVCQETDEEAAAFDVYARSEWPSLYSGGVSGQVSKELGREVLGAGSMRDAGELREILGLDRPRWQGKATRLAAHLDHSARGARGLLRRTVSIGL